MIAAARAAKHAEGAAPSLNSVASYALQAKVAPTPVAKDDDDNEGDGN
jgi:hypothetical protein